MDMEQQSHVLRVMSSLFSNKWAFFPDEFKFDPITAESLKTEKAYVKVLKKHQKELESLRKRQQKERNLVQKSQCGAIEKIVKNKGRSVHNSPFVVYLDQQMGALHAVHWERSFFCIKTSFFVLSCHQWKKRKKKERKVAQKHAKTCNKHIFPQSWPAFGCQPAFKNNT